MDLGQFAAALSRTSAELQSSAASRCARAAGGAFLGELKKNTPVESGALRNSEAMKVTGGGSSARAHVQTHLPLYASFREYGGTIRAHDRSRGGWVGAPRVINGVRHGHHTLHWPGGGFPMQVTQKGSHYMARTMEWAGGGGMDGPLLTAITRIFHENGL